jgi:DNA mismatch endonuclease (patch repair protein)
LRLLREAGISGWRRDANLPGKPDFVFKGKRVAVFIDGCFWHGCPRCFRLPEDNRRYWRAKIMANRARDRRTRTKLRSLNWRVIRIWEHSLKSPPARSRVIARLVQSVLN